MLGAALTRCLELADFEVCRATLSEGIDIADVVDVEFAFRKAKPDVAVNCVGIVKSECSERAVAVNARAPHAMAYVARKYDARFVHVSTDGVFSGRRGNYYEDDVADAEDLYGQTKAAGEIVDRPDCLTIRTSFIGRDPRRRRGLLEWLLTKDVVQGYTQSLWSGLSATELARAIVLAIDSNLSGLYHVAGDFISKADLLEVIVKELGLGCHIERVPGEPVDRTLNSCKFNSATGYVTPSWAHMAEELKSNA
jgi:dTDP-4-dehydrorhamnose reductase